MCGGSKNPDGPSKSGGDRSGGGPQVAKSSHAVSPTSVIPKRVPTKKFLDAILSSKELTTALEAFLETEFCIENLVFIQKTGIYRDAFNKSDVNKNEDRIKLQEIREEILKDFMLPTSEKEVNIPAKIKRECLINMEQLKTKGLKMDSSDYAEMSARVFEGCEQHVKQILVQERIGRFQQTDGFAKVASAVPDSLK